MNDLRSLTSQFCVALNAELAALGCKLHISDCDLGPGDTMLLLSADGRELGWVPDHVDAPVIAAFERILKTIDERRAAY